MDDITARPLLVGCNKWIGPTFPINLVRTWTNLKAPSHHFSVALITLWYCSPASWSPLPTVWLHISTRWHCLYPQNHWLNFNSLVTGHIFAPLTGISSSCRFPSSSCRATADGLCLSCPGWLRETSGQEKPPSVGLRRTAPGFDRPWQPLSLAA